MIKRLVVVAVAVGTACLSVTLGASAPGNAQNVAADGELTIGSLTPAVVLPSNTLALSGALRNTGTEDAANIDFSLRISTSPLASTEELDEISAGDYEPGTRSVSGGTYQTPELLAPDSSARWTVSVPGRALDLYTSGVYYVSVQAFSDRGEIGKAHTFLPWFPPDSSVNPVKLVWLWPVSDQPNRTATNALLSNQTGDEVSTGGRLDRVLDYGLAAKDSVTWVVDPATLETVGSMSNGYDILSPNGDVVPGTSSTAAGAWISKLRGGLASRPFYAMPYAYPDVTALVSRTSNLSDIVTRSITTASERAATAIGKQPVATLGWPAGPRFEATALETMHRAGIRTTVIDDSAVVDAANQAVANVSTEDGTILGLLSHPAISGSVSDPGPTAATALDARQQFLARTALWAQSASTDAYLVVAPDPLWDPARSVVLPIVRSLSRARWLRPVPLSDLNQAATRDRTPSSSLAEMNQAARRAALGPRFTKSIQASQQRLTGLAAIVDTPNTVTEPYSSALIRSGSASWRDNRASGLELTTAVTRELSAQINAVRVLPGGIKNLSSDNVDIPVTIANDLAVPVTVGLELSSEPRVRLTADSITNITVPAGRKVSVSVPAQVLGSGAIEATAQLLTPEGRPYGKPVGFTLQNSSYSQAATWVVSGAFVVLVGLLTANSVRRRRERRRAAQDGEPRDAHG